MFLSWSFYSSYSTSCKWIKLYTTIYYSWQVILFSSWPMIQVLTFWNISKVTVNGNTRFFWRALIEGSSTWNFVWLSYCVEIKDYLVHLRSVDRIYSFIWFLSIFFSDAWADRLNVIPNNTESVALGAITVRIKKSSFIK
jgi:hypothetical protein